jgi:hypothetical protein
MEDNADVQATRPCIIIITNKKKCNVLYNMRHPKERTPLQMTINALKNNVATKLASLFEHAEEQQL